MSLKPPSDEEIKKMMPLGEDYSRHENEAYCFGLVEMRNQWKAANDRIVERLEKIKKCDDPDVIKGELIQLIYDLK